jgi:dTDP-4-amino-4,6-dideoxygalactose transaminase
MQVPLVDLASQHREVADEVRQGFEEVYADTSFIHGKAVTSFEESYASYVGVRHCIGVGNGTDAIELSLRASGVGIGDEVLLPVNTFVATAEAVVRAGATPVLVDVDDRYLLMDMEAAAAATGPRTKAYLPVHLYGQSVDMGALLKLAEQSGALVVEDAAQSQGARWHGQMTGSFGLAAATSFYPGKNLGAYGDAGAVLTNDDDVARRVRMLGDHGSAAKYDHEMIGTTSRLDSLQAVVLSAKLRKLDGWNAARRAAAARYDSLLRNHPGIEIPGTAAGGTNVWHLYVIRVDDRDAVLDRLRGMGIGAGVHYPTPLHLTGAFAHLGQGRGAFPVAERASTRILSLPLHPHLTTQQQDRVVEALLSALPGQ